MTLPCTLPDPAPTGRLLHVGTEHLSADDSGPGTEERPYKTISCAAQEARPGDTIVVHDGIYRERVTPIRGGEPNRPITYRAAPGEIVAVRGSEVWSPEWHSVPDCPAVLEGALDPELLGDFNPYAARAQSLPGVFTLGQLFCNSEPLTEVDDLDTLLALPGTWRAISEGSALQVHFPLALEPESAILELTVRNRIFAPQERGLGYITVCGFVFEHCANRSAGGFWEPEGTQSGAVSCRAGHHWVIEHCIIRNAKTIGLDCGNEGGRERAGNPVLTPQQVGYHVIQHNTISDNGQCGITGLGQTGTQVRYNRIERNNAIGFGAVEEAGIKFHYFYDGVIEGNLVRDNDAHGIWLDNVWYGSRVTRNVCLNNLYAGIFIELGDGPCLVDNNIVAGTRQGEGIYTHDASGVTIAHNLLYANAHFGINVRLVSEREVLTADGSIAMSAASRQRLLNNVSIDNYRGHFALPLPSARCQDNVCSHNLFVNGTQWHWEGAATARFCIGTNDGRIVPAALQTAYREVMNGMPRQDTERISPELWSQNPAVDLMLWCALTGWDRSSTAIEAARGEVRNGALEKGSITLSVRDAWLYFRSAALFSQVACPPVEDVVRDFCGMTYSVETIRPGPFQNLPDAEARIVLFPIRCHSAE